MRFESKVFNVPLCYLCGEEDPNLQFCAECGQLYCSMHLDPEIHECRIVKESLNPNSPLFVDNIFVKEEPPSKNESSNPRIDSDVSSVPLRIIDRPVDQRAGEVYRCNYCKNGVSSVYFCVFCQQYFCKDHREPVAHRCSPSLSRSVFEFEPEGPLSVPTNLFLTKPGVIRLDRSTVTQTLKNLVESYANDENDILFAKLLKENPKGIKLIQFIHQFVRHPLIESLLIWLSSNTSTLKEGLSTICKECEVRIEDFTLFRLINEHYTYLFDASYYDKIAGVGLDSSIDEVPS